MGGTRMIRLGNTARNLDPNGPRAKLFKALLEESSMCSGDDSGRMRVGRPTAGGGMTWTYATSNTTPTYSYRTVLPNQIVFDVGDDGDWNKCVQDTHALWDALNWLGIPYWGSLSGGKGTHTEVFGPVDMDREERLAVARTILHCARVYKSGSSWGRGIAADELLLDPNEGSRLIREFGAHKSAGPKALWCKGPSSYIPLPDTREEAYEMAGRLNNGTPITIPRDETLTRLAIGTIPVGYGTCPVGPQCLPSPEWDQWDLIRGCCAECKRYD